MDVSNSSLYDGGSAAVEAVLMALHSRPRANRVVVLQSVHPEYRQILATYLANVEVELVTVPTPGRLAVMSIVNRNPLTPAAGSDADVRLTRSGIPATEPSKYIVIVPAAAS